MAWPPAEDLKALDELVSLGYFRGILQTLAGIEAAHPECAAFVQRVRAQAREFQFEAIAHLLKQAFHEQQPTP
jgi:hypothetical protein